MSASIDYAAGGEAAYTGTMPGDTSDAAHMAQFAQPGMSWWESLISYGAVRAIDNRFAPAPVAGNVTPGSYAGQNGQTYMNGQPVQAFGQGMSSGTLLLIGGAVLAAFALAG